ncbi:diguanylate cyclase domain-containing protein [Thiomicrorhabdus sediminis]|uniref:diguanylate cyclase domain-containing protein n=1 Tax=Thiomicrorhabdus sediminis TaxID=2580412 RepID=UPI00143D7DBC|nr:GGDEF domain-containing protein [Thiomicrorhabdus sediminis]
MATFIYVLRKKEQQTIHTLEFKAEHDSLTELPNRYYLENHFKSQTIKATSSISLLFIDLDNFKNVNDTFGHHIGDKLLIQVADRLKQQLSVKGDIIRFGGDEIRRAAG